MNPDIGMMAVRDYVEETCIRCGWSAENQNGFLSDISFEYRYIKDGISINVKFWKAKLLIRSVSLMNRVASIYCPVDPGMVKHYKVDLADPTCFVKFEDLLRRI